MDEIRAEQVRFQYDGEGDTPVLVLDGIDLTIEKGSFVALLGHNGSGKSTLAKHFNAMLLPTGGRVLVQGRDTADETLTFDIRRTVGMVLQNPDNQMVSTIVEEDVAFGPENLGVAPQEIRRRVDDALRTVGMYDYRLHAPHKLSGGQKQRVAIAGILAMQPDCLVLDEPTAMLDPQGRLEVLATIERLNRECGMTVVLITHYMDEAARAQRVVVMDDGHILLDGTPRTVFSQADALRRVKLDVPQPTELTETLRAAGVPLPAGILTADECADAIFALAASAPTTAAAPANGACSETASAAAEGPATAVLHPSCVLSDAAVASDTAAASSGQATTAPETPPVIETRGLTFTYAAGTPFEKTAMRDVSLTIPKGELLGIIGHTGSGKSTLVQQLNGLLRPTAGTVLLDGTDIWEQPKAIRSIRFRVGMVFQYPEHQLFESTVFQDIAFGPRNMGLDDAEIDARVRRAAAFVGLRDELLEKSPFELSGGEKRRAAIAGVMAMQPEVLILDEPTAGLDPRGRDRILERVLAYKQETGATVLLVSHSMEDIARVATSVLVMHDGRVAMHGTADQVFSRASELEAIGLAVPAVTQIAMRLRDRGLAIGGITTANGTQPGGALAYTVPQAAAQLLPLLPRRTVDDPSKGGGAHA